ncbi:HIT family protein [Candidatus Nanohalococcus occultus]|uniref:HIT family hydrolase n=1 Tax=Candidatus Nanohalococcus occultus TaxID=2978047 RepID=A0ABY8CFE4_9ARCH|nr:HIT family hydrolase [Candidatus Nanohaloarchaeota archaeon SVXNc]
MSEDCVFCKIIEGQIPSNKVYEDENVVAFLDANPVSKGHTLVVPKAHVDTVFDAESMEYMWKPIVKVANAIREAFDVEDMNINQNNGSLAGQEVDHLHFHLTPRYDGSEIDISYNRSEPENADEVAEQIRSKTA